MHAEAAGLDGSYLITPDRFGDERGYFARLWDPAWAEALGIETCAAQTNASYNRSRGTIRGLHWQAAPHHDAKLLRCTRGAVFDVAVDLRPGSPTFGRWQGHRLDPESGTAVFVPGGCAHGYQALEDGSEVTYGVSQPYVPSAERGVRWNDPALAIAWPITEGIIVSDKDRAWPDLALEALT